MNPRFSWAVILAAMLVATPLLSQEAHAWSNGGYSSSPSTPKYGTHDWIAERALDFLPPAEKEYIEDNLATYLYGTELPDNGGAPDGIGDFYNHHVYYASDGTVTDDAAARRAAEEQSASAWLLADHREERAAKRAGVMAHYIGDVAVFGHVMGSGTPWGSEAHHSDYESAATSRTPSYSAMPAPAFDGSLRNVSARSAVLAIAFNTTFGDGGLLKACRWMDANYGWSNTAFVSSFKASLALAVNALADVLHTIYWQAAALSLIPPPPPPEPDVPPVALVGFNATDAGDEWHVQLDGRMSLSLSDVETLDYAWSVDNESAGTSPLVEIFADARTYRWVELTVTVPGGLSNTTARALLLGANASGNHAPAGVLSAPPHANRGSEVTLALAGLRDPDGDPVSCALFVNGQETDWPDPSAPLSVSFDFEGVATLRAVLADPFGAESQSLSAVIVLGRPPVAMISAEDGSYAPRETILLDGSGSSDPDGSPLQFAWFVDGVLAPAFNGSATMVVSFDAPGVRNVTLRVSDGFQSSEKSIEVTVAGGEDDGGDTWAETATKASIALLAVALLVAFAIVASRRRG